MKLFVALVLAMLAVSAVAETAEEKLEVAANELNAEQETTQSAGEQESAAEDTNDVEDEDEDEDEDEEAEAFEDDDETADEEDEAAADEEDEVESEASTDAEDVAAMDSTPEEDSEEDDSDLNDSDSDYDTQDIMDSEERISHRLEPEGGSGPLPRPRTRDLKGELANLVNNLGNMCPGVRRKSSSCKNLSSYTSCPNTPQDFKWLSDAYRACGHVPAIRDAWNMARGEPFSLCRYDCKQSTLVSAPPSAKFKELLKDLKDTDDIQDSDDNADANKDMGGSGWWCCFGWC